MRKNFKNYLAIFHLLVLFACLVSAFTMNDNEAKKKKKVLVFSKTSGYRHESIEAGIIAIKKLGTENQFEVDATEDSLAFTGANLKKYKAVVFLSTTLNVLGEAEQKALTAYMQKGGGFVGIHAATDCEYDWAWYVKMVGASFASHPEQQTAKLVVNDFNHPSTKHLPAIWERWDEWYNFKNINGEVKVLLEIDETSYKGGTNGRHHPMAWCHDYDGGRAFYTALGHTIESYSEPLFLQHILGGIEYAMGQK
jgi:uncharacterized protein